MKKIFLSLFVGLQFLATAASADDYVLTGSVGTDNSKYPFGMIFDPATGDILEEVEVQEDGSFLYRGSADTIGVLELVFDLNLPKSLFFTEPGALHADPATGLVTGTPLNDDYARLLTRLHEAGDPKVGDSVCSALYLDVYRQHPADLLGVRSLLLASERMSAAELGVYLAKATPYVRQHKLLQTQLRGKFGRENAVNGRPYIEVRGLNAATSQGADSLHEAVSDSLALSALIGASGRWTLVDFWASWCGPCCQGLKTQLPEVLAKYGERLNVVGVACDDELPSVQKALQKFHVTWPVLFSPTANELYGVRVVPSFFLIDPEGVIRASRVQMAELDSLLSVTFTR
jgi:thiol-disulfide isomerase/thioredoxin